MIRVTRDVKIQGDVMTIKTKDIVREALDKHWPWMVGILFAVGITYGSVTIKQIEMGKTLDSNVVALEVNKIKIVEVEKNIIGLHATDNMAMSKLDNISSDIKDLKNTIEKLDMKMNDRMTKMDASNQKQFDELKKILFKPAIGTTWIENDNSKLASSMLKGVK